MRNALREYTAYKSEPYPATVDEWEDWAAHIVEEYEQTIKDILIRLGKKTNQIIFSKNLESAIQLAKEADNIIIDEFGKVTAWRGEE